jgi:outer membrane protein TolC
MNLKIKYLFWFLIVLIINFNWALGADSVTSPLSWKSSLTTARAFNKELKIAKEKLNEFKAAREIPQSSTFPQLSSSLASQYSSTQTTSGLNTNLSLTAKQSLFDGFKTLSAIEVADLNIHSAELDYWLKESEIFYKLRQSFYEVLRSQELLKLSEQLMVRRKQQLSLVKLRYEAGLEHRGSLFTAEANLARAENDIVQTKRNLMINQKTLAQIMGQDDLKNFTVTADLKLEIDLSTEPEMEQLIAATPAYLKTQLDQSAAEYQLKISQADYWPEISLQGSYFKTLQETAAFGNDGRWNVGLNLNLSLIDFGKRDANVKMAESRLKQVEFSIQNTVSLMKVQLAQAWTGLQNAFNQIQVSQKFLEATQERSTIAGVQYSSGLISFDNWIIIENDFANARRDYLNTQVDAVITEAKWRQLKGEKLNEE